MCPRRASVPTRWGTKPGITRGHLSTVSLNEVQGLGLTMSYTPAAEKHCVPFHNPFTCLRKDTRRCETEVSLRSTSCWELIETVVWDGIKVLEGMMVGRLLDGLER